MIIIRLQMEQYREKVVDPCLEITMEPYFLDCLGVAPPLSRATGTTRS